MKYLDILKLIFSMLPLIHAIVDQVEEMFPYGGYGAQKLALVKDMLEKAMAVSDLSGAAFERLWPMFSGVIANIVLIKKSVSKDVKSAISTAQ